MELPQSWRLEAEGRKPTHDFLSLYSHSSVQQDRRPPSQGGYLKTHDFLQLELGNTTAKEEIPVEEAMTEKPPPPPAPPRSVGHILPGGIGTYNISHKTEGPLFTTVAQWSSSERNYETSNCSSYSGSGFTLWEDSAATKGKTRKENTGKTPAISEELRVKVDGKRAVDLMDNTPRSKHSATEQRRRSKINDRFQMLRGIIPNSDQKRDKASFLLEVVEYIQSLQEKVQKYEGAYQGWNHEPSKLIPWSNSERPTEDHADRYRDINGVSTPALFFSVAPNIAGAAMNPVQSDMRSATTSRPIDLGPVMMKKAMPFLVSPQPNLITPSQSTCRLPSDPETNGAIPTKNPIQQELTVEDGTISISSVYSQGLLSTLTRTLQASGVDLSHATISVQIDIGKQSSTLKGCSETPPTKQGAAHSRDGFIEDSDRPMKKLKI